ncbi:MAG: hypothetical protein KF739_07485 [Cryobacterium sp.]|nr:hypothetical protein [Cryobacterium sp.]
MHEDRTDELTILRFIEPGLVDRLYPFGELAESGATLAAGSGPSTPDPLAAIPSG